jgi:peroxiredoxin
LVVPLEITGKLAMPSSMPRSHAAAICAVALGFGSVAFAADKQDSKSGQAGKSQYDVPEGTPQELLDFIQKQRESQPTGTTRKMKMDHLRNVCESIVKAAERIREAKADDKTTVAALKAELEALTMLKRLGEDGAEEKFDAFTASLKNDKRPAVANLLKLQALAQKFDKLDRTDAKDVAAFAADVKAYARTAEADIQLAYLAQAATVLLDQSGQPEESAAVGRELIEKLSRSKTPDVIMAAARLTATVGQNLESQGQERQAAKLYREISERLAKSDHEALHQVAEQLEVLARKLDLVGQPMPISGKLVDGGNFDISQFKGKVVLVDFWATWCRPCMEEMPNVKDVYEKYHERGFEVVGISLDNERDDLTKCIEEKHIPWPILFEGGEETSGWDHPLAKKYEVTGIPRAVLVDREGKVVTLSARGERLAELVDELIGTKAKSANDADVEKKKAG